MYTIWIVIFLSEIFTYDCNTYTYKNLSTGLLHLRTYIIPGKKWASWQLTGCWRHGAKNAARQAVENDVKLSKLTQSQRKMYISTFKCTSILILSFQQELYSLLRKLKFICTHLRSRTWARAAWYGRDGRVGHWRRRYLPQQQGQVQHQRPGTVQRLKLYITKHLFFVSRL